MLGDSVDYVKGETPMTDYQFKYMMDLKEANSALKEKCDTLTREVATLREENAALMKDLKNS